MGKDVTDARSFCSSPYHKGPRWLLSVYFYRRARSANGLQRWCKTCTRIGIRSENISEYARANRNKYLREYKAQQRRNAGIEPRAGKLLFPFFDGKKLTKYIDERIRKEEIEDGRPILKLNGYVLTKEDQRYLHHLRTGIDRTSYLRVDRFVIDYDLQMWELIEAAGCYKLDKRVKLRKQMAKQRANGGSKNRSKERKGKQAPL